MSETQHFKDYHRETRIFWARLAVMSSVMLALLGVLVYRIMNKNTLKDFLYRSNLPIPEDQALQQNPKFWELIEAATRTAHQHPAPPVVEK